MSYVKLKFEDRKDKTVQSDEPATEPPDLYLICLERFFLACAVE